MRRTRLLTYLIALITLVTGALVFMAPTANADTAQLEIQTEAWFGRFKEEDPQTNLPCYPPGTPTTIENTTTYACGPVSPGDYPAPQSKGTGHYVVASAGGEAGADDGQGDTAWAAFEWDVFDYLGATADKFVVKLHLGMDRCTPGECYNQGDTYRGSGTPPPIQACVILEAWNGETGPNPWFTRPRVGTECVVPKLDPDNPLLFVFDLTSMADKWLAEKGYGFVIRPGTPDKTTGLEPFQITFSGYYDGGTDHPRCTSVGVPVPGTPTGSTVPGTPVVIEDPERETACTTTDIAPEPIVEFAYTPAFEDDFDFDDDDGGGGGGDLDEDITEDIPGDDEFEAEPDIDVIPTDVGSDEEFTDEVSVEGELTDDGGDVAAPTRRRTRPISNTPFPWAILLLLPLVAIAFWSTGTALGPVGDPVSARRGGVSRVLAERQAAHRGTDIDPRNRA